LLMRLGSRTDAPFAAVASFHLRGQPIVRTEADAVEAFRRSALDALVVERRLYEPRR
jgi:predicted NodU family carbamoyl transferase